MKTKKQERMFRNIKSSLYKAIYRDGAVLLCAEVDEGEFIMHGRNYTKEHLIATVDAIFEVNPDIASLYEKKEVVHIH